MSKSELPMRSFPSAAAFGRWLLREHHRSDGIWLAIAKKESGIASPTYAEALEVALTFGWIDGQKNALDEKRWLQRFTPRTAKSKWSKINCAKAEALIAAGKMHAAGLAQIALAKADGRWAAAYDSPRSAEVPADLERALSKNKKAGAFFATLDRANRYAILYRLHHTTKAEARAKKIETFVRMLARGEKLHDR